PGGSTRLPTEAEWEYAARAGCERPPCGADGEPAEIAAVAWMTGNSTGEDGEVRFSPVGLLEPSPYGLYDIYGNVWEWTSGWEGAYPPENPAGPTVGAVRYRVLGGGSALLSAQLIHPSQHAAIPPERRVSSAGLRPIRDLPQG
ncbi:MAG: formylglycine-generating enzyme family protein, partial [Acidobacteriota bacterium]